MAAAPLVVLMVVVVEDSRAFGWQQDVTAYCEGGYVMNSVPVNLIES